MHIKWKLSLSYKKELFRQAYNEDVLLGSADDHWRAEPGTGTRSWPPGNSEASDFIDFLFQTAQFFN